VEIALVFPKSTFLSDPMTWPPLGLWYLGAQLEAQGHKTEFFDLSTDELPADGDFDQMWLSATSPQMAEVRRIANLTSGWKTRRVYGGADPWANPGGSKDLGFDLVVSGESDHPETVAAMVKAADERSPNFMTPAITKETDWILPPIRRWADRYHSYMADSTGKKHRMTSLFTSRGCPMECAFCESGRHGVIWDRMTRYESVPLVEEQIRQSVEMGFSGLAYYDDIFIVNRRRTLELLDLHIKYNVVYRCFLRSDILCKHGGKEYLQRMKDAGLIEVFVGVESADNQIKANIHKGTTIEQDTAVLEWCKELGVTCKMSFILGLPGESTESMNKTRDWILKHRPHRTQVDRLIPFPGTPLTKNAAEYDLTYETQVEEEWFFRGRQGSGRSFVSTSHLSVDEIDAFWQSLEVELDQEGISR